MRDLFAGIDACHKGHKNITVAKLMHAVVCYRDMTEGSGNWQWTDGVTPGGNLNSTVDINQSMSTMPLVGINQI